MSKLTTTQRIEELRKHEENWDGYDAIKPRRDVLERAIAMLWLNDFPAPDIVVPEKDGSGVILIWRDEPDETIELHIHAQSFRVYVSHKLRVTLAATARQFVTNGLRRIGVTK